MAEIFTPSSSYASRPVVRTSRNPRPKASTLAMLRGFARSCQAVTSAAGVPGVVVLN